METLKNISKYVIAFIAGFTLCYVFFPRIVTNAVAEPKKVTGAVNTNTKTELAYVPKKTTVINGTTQRENTDIDVRIPKQELNVKINGKEATVSKVDDEKYLFEKNKLQLQQKSTAEINVKVPVQDNTKLWSIGVGYGNNGLAGTVGFPINKAARVGGWVYADKKTGAGGIKIMF